MASMLKMPMASSVSSESRRRRTVTSIRWSTLSVTILLAVWKNAAYSNASKECLEQGEDDVLTQLHGHSVSYRIATGRPQQGCKVFTLQTLARTGG